MTTTISPLVKELKDLNSARQVHGQLLQAQKKRLETREKDRKKSGLPIRALFEVILKKHGVDRAAHHGGDLTGVSIGIMFNRSEAILGDLKTFLHEEVAPCDRACDDTEINDVLTQF
jgi:hypothetical protein